MIRRSLSLWHTYVVIIVLLFTGFPASADEIIPSNRVTSQVRVREAPNVSSPVVGAIRFNESANLIESVPYW